MSQYFKRSNNFENDYLKNERQSSSRDSPLI